MSEESSITMGVDFGTTNSCVAIMEPAGPRVLTHDYDKRIFPSTFSIENGVWSIGKHQTTDYTGGFQFIHNVKRILGRTSKDGLLAADIDKWGLPFLLDEGGEPFCQVGSEKVRPVEFVALLLFQAKKVVEDATGKKVKGCVITVPAYFSDAQRRATHEAAKIADLQVLRLLNEPTAIALAQLWNSERTGRFLVVDAGGGTIDCSKVNLSSSKEAKTFVVEATSGDNSLGGDDFSTVLAQLLQKQVDRAEGVPFNELKALCETAKKQRDDVFRINVRGKPYKITQDQYTRALSRYFQRIRRIVREAWGGDALEGVILAGGASYQRAFSDLVHDLLQDYDFLPPRPAAEVVAEGAAIMTSIGSTFFVTDVLSRSLGIDTQDSSRRKEDIMDIVLKRNTPLPASFTRTFTTVNEKETEIHLYEGEYATSSKNNSLGRFYIGAPAGQAVKVKITATSDAQILLEATAEPGTGKLNVTRKESELSDSMFRTMREKSQQRFESGTGNHRTTGAKRKRKTK